MDEFQKEVIERLTRLEIGVSGLKTELRAFKTKLAIVASVIATAVSATFAYFKGA